MLEEEHTCVRPQCSSSHDRNTPHNGNYDSQRQNNDNYGSQRQNNDNYESQRQNKDNYGSQRQNTGNYGSQRQNNDNQRDYPSSAHHSNYDNQTSYTSIRSAHPAACHNDDLPGNRTFTRDNSSQQATHSHHGNRTFTWDNSRQHVTPTSRFCHQRTQPNVVLRCHDQNCGQQTGAPDVIHQPACSCRQQPTCAHLASIQTQAVHPPGCCQHGVTVTLNCGHCREGRGRSLACHHNQQTSCHRQLYCYCHGCHHLYCCHSNCFHSNHHNCSCHSNHGNHCCHIHNQELPCLPRIDFSHINIPVPSTPSSAVKKDGKSNVLYV